MCLQQVVVTIPVSLWEAERSDTPQDTPDDSEGASNARDKRNSVCVRVCVVLMF